MSKNSDKNNKKKSRLSKIVSGAIRRLPSRRAVVNAAEDTLGGIATGVQVVQAVVDPFGFLIQQALEQAFEGHSQDSEYDSGYHEYSAFSSRDQDLVNTFSALFKTFKKFPSSTEWNKIKNERVIKFAKDNGLEWTAKKLCETENSPEYNLCCLHKTLLGYYPAEYFIDYYNQGKDPADHVPNYSPPIYPSVTSPQHVKTSETKPLYSTPKSANQINLSNGTMMEITDIGNKFLAYKNNILNFKRTTIVEDVRKDFRILGKELGIKNIERILDLSNNDSLVALYNIEQEFRTLHPNYLTRIENPNKTQRPDGDLQVSYQPIASSMISHPSIRNANQINLSNGTMMEITDIRNKFLAFKINILNFKRTTIVEDVRSDFQILGKQLGIKNIEPILDLSNNDSLVALYNIEQEFRTLHPNYLPLIDNPNKTQRPDGDRQVSYQDRVSPRTSVPGEQKPSSTHQFMF
ncbi:MAG: hypothetical protein IPP74_04060 [Alphaproteobacteria bacterium]|nr:hypothetical protein [Alphaproteobacteria bacterium]